jgi:hypothetical protein
MLVEDVALLFHQELQLAKAEIGEKAHQVRSAMVAIIIGLLFGLASVVILAQAATVGLTQFLPDWLAAASTGLLLALAAMVAFKVGASLLEPENLRLSRTIDSVSDDATRLRKGLPS